MKKKIISSLLFLLFIFPITPYADDVIKAEDPSFITSDIFDVIKSGLNNEGSEVKIEKVGKVISGEITFTQINLVIESTPTEWTNQNVVITATATATDANGISKIILPDNTEVNADTATYTVTENGTYSFKAIDTAGNMIEKSIEITNIDKVKPTMVITVGK